MIRTGHVESVEEFALDLMEDAVLILEENEIICSSNRSFERLTNLSRASLRGKRCTFPFLTLEEQFIFMKCLMESLQTNTSVSYGPFHFTVVGKTEIQYVAAKFNPFDNGKTRYCICVFQTLTQELSERYKYLEQFDKYSDSTVDIIEYDPFLNDFILLFQSSRSQAKNTHELNKYMIRDLHLQFEDRVLIKYKEFYQQLTSSNVHEFIGKTVIVADFHQNKHLQQSVVFLGVSVYSNRPQFLVKTYDIPDSLQHSLTKREQDMANIIDRANILKTFFDNCPVMMGVVKMNMNRVLGDGTLDMTNLFANPSAAALFNRNTAEATTGLKGSELGWSSEEVIGFQKYFVESFRLGVPVVFEFELKNKKKRKRSVQLDVTWGDPEDVEVMWISACVNHIGGSKFIYLCQDITSRKQLEKSVKRHHYDLENLVKARTKQLEDALEVKSRFLAIVSHEMRTPLSGILGMLTLLTESTIDSQHKEMVHIASVCGEQLMMVINDILDFSRLEQNKLPLEAVPFSLYQILEESLEVVAFESEKKQIDLICDIDPSLHDSVVGDATRLRQILINLLGNAVKFTMKGEITLTATGKNVDDGYLVEFSVKDQGIGIPPEVQSKIFEPFQQADTSFSRKFGGSGLGLSISKRLAQSMGGDMWFESEENKGTTFHFTIITKKSQPSRVSEDASLLAGKSILIVDPSVDFSQFLWKRLKAWGMNVETVTSTKEAIEMNKEFDTCLIDSRQPVEEIDIIQKKTKVILLGASRQTELELPFLIKPIRLTKLKLVLLQMFGSTVPEPAKPEVVFASNSTSLRILVAEDNSMNQKVIKRVLESLGYKNVDIVDDGKMAVDAVKAKKYDIILMDCMMPNMNGYEATEKIRAEVPLEEQPLIVALTANAFPENRKRCFLAGMSHVLTKPIQKKELTEILQNCELKS